MLTKKKACCDQLYVYAFFAEKIWKEELILSILYNAIKMWLSIFRWFFIYICQVLIILAMVSEVKIK